jgi:hypothetical protein
MAVQGCKRAPGHRSARAFDRDPLKHQRCFSISRRPVLALQPGGQKLLEPTDDTAGVADLHEANQADAFVRGDP